MVNSDYLKNLNKAQKEAVLYLEGLYLLLQELALEKQKFLPLE